MHGQLLAESGHNLQNIGHSMTAHAARLEALRLLPPTPTPTGPGSGPAGRPGALCDPEGDWILVELQDNESDGAQ